MLHVSFANVSLHPRAIPTWQTFFRVFSQNLALFLQMIFSLQIEKFLSYYDIRMSHGINI